MKKNKALPIIPPVANADIPDGYNPSKCEFVINKAAIILTTVTAFIYLIFLQESPTQ